LGQTAATASGWSGPPSESRWRWCTSRYGPFLPWKGAGWRQLSQTPGLVQPRVLVVASLRFKRYTVYCWAAHSSHLGYL
jgi:hypothetical protein